MRFAVANTVFLQSAGFDTTHFRQSADGKQALVHDQFAETLLGDLRQYPQVQVYDKHDEAFIALLADRFSAPDIPLPEEDE